MTEEETRETMIKVGSLAAMATSVAVGGCTEGFDHDPDQVELLLAQALQASLEEIDGDPEISEVRMDLLAATRRFLEAVT
jgi:hypothetical protein